jgi:homoserine kinase
MRITVRVPATSANLGPGFDCFGLALDLCNEIVIDTAAESGVTWEGEGADELPTDGSDMVSRAMQHTLEQQRGFHPDAALPPFALHGVNRIPLERGLGSSSAAAVAGVVAASRLLGDAGWGPDDHDAYTTSAYAAMLEGHWDNAAPAAFGGFTIVADGVRRFEPHPALSPVALIPGGARVRTDDARRALPADVPRQYAVLNIGYAALVALAITQDPSLLLVALHDRLHQDVRLALVPEARELFDDLWKRQVPVCVSGAGPSLLAFETEDLPVPDPGDGWRVLRVPIRSRGYEVDVQR